MSSAIITAECKPGATIEQIAYDMHDLASQVTCNVKFAFEGIEITISEYRLPEEIVKEWKDRKKANDIIVKHLKDARKLLGFSEDDKRLEIL